MFMTQKKPLTPSPIPRQSRQLQRKCACGGNITAGGECEQCKKKNAAAREVTRANRTSVNSSSGSSFDARRGHNFGSVRIHSGARSEGSYRPAYELTDPTKPRDPAAPGERAAKVKGTPTAIEATDNSIICKGEALVVQNTNTGADTSCTQAHEGSHIQDWRDRYGADLCKGVADGSLPTGGAGYDEFLRKSECKAYKVGEDCRDTLLTTAADADKAAIQAGIDRDKAQLVSHNCT